MASTLDFAVIGAQKAASTWVTNNLGEHPQVWIPLQEIPCFEADYPQTDPLGTMQSPHAGPLVRGVKNNNLFFRPESARRLFEHAPELKLIVSLRDPVDRLLSAYYWYMWVGLVPVQPPEEGLRRAIAESDDALLGPGFYGRHLARFLEVFDADRILTILFEDIRDRPGPTLANAYTFIGVDPAYESPRLVARPKASVYSLPRIRWNALRNPHILRSDSGAGGRVLWKQKLTPAEQLINGLIAGTDRVLLSRFLPNAKPQISKELRHAIADVYADDVRQLQGILGRDLSHWPTLRLASKP